MDTDIRLKVLFQQYGQGLLPITGDGSAVFRSARSIEVHDLRRSVDCVMELQQGDTIYYRHLEFQAQPDAEMAERCFRYNTQLLLQLKAPVLTTVVYLRPPGPKERHHLQYSVELDGRQVNVWRFDVVRLWEHDVAEAFASGAPGMLALVPLMAGGGSMEATRTAAQGIQRAAPDDRLPDALAILLHLTGRSYTIDDLAYVLGGRRKMMESTFNDWLQARETKGLLQGLRTACQEQVRKHHPALLVRAEPVIEACADPELLQKWLLEAVDHDDAGFATLLGLS